MALDPETVQQQRELEAAAEEIARVTVITRRKKCIACGHWHAGQCKGRDRWGDACVCDKPLVRWRAFK